jgi:hypothetical protein
MFIKLNSEVIYTKKHNQDLAGLGTGVRSPPVSPTSTGRLWGPPNLLTNEYRGRSSRRIRKAERQATHLSPSTAEIRNAGSISI